MILLCAAGVGVSRCKRKRELLALAVITKVSSGILAKELDADYFIILTSVEKAALDYKQTNQKDLSVLTVTDARAYLDAGQFPSGSMGPKIEAAIDFIESGGKYAMITSIEKLSETLDGKAGTRITR